MKTKVLPLKLIDSVSLLFLFPDIDECSLGSAGCHGDQECVNTPGSFRCDVRCHRGMRPSEDGTRCVGRQLCSLSLCQTSLTIL